MAFQARSEATAMSEINVTPLVDVMLVLLVVFIITAPLLTRAVRVDLPRAAATAPLTQTRHLHLSMDAQGAVFIEKRPIAAAAVGAELKNMLREKRDLAVQLHADQNVPYGRVAQLMAEVQRAGVTKIALVVLPQQ